MVFFAVSITVTVTERTPLSFAGRVTNLPSRLYPADNAADVQLRWQVDCPAAPCDVDAASNSSRVASACKLRAMWIGADRQEFNKIAATHHCSNLYRAAFNGGAV